MSACSSKRKRKTISLDEKAAILRAVAAGTKKSQVAKEFDIAPSTLSTILGSKDVIADAIARGVKGSRKKLRSAAFEAVEKALFTWFLDTRAANVPVSGALLQRKARDFACIMGFDSFVASAGWLQRFKERHDIVGKVISGECQSVDKEEATAWVKSTIGPLLERYDERDVFNADETGLFFQMLPQRSLSLKGDRCHGGKQSKVRITVLLCANMDGSEKMPPLVIGKSASPRCFKGKQKLRKLTEKKTLGVNPGSEQIRHTMGEGAGKLEYVSNKKAWMTRDIFAKWLRDWDEKLKKQKRKICLFLDNCTAHHTSALLENIEVRFLPPNSTAIIQPLDQGVIMAFKADYRKRLIDRLLINMSLKRETNIDLYMAIEMLQAAWISVTASIIANCFRHASFARDASDFGDDESVDFIAVPDEAAASDEVVAAWKALHDAGVVSQNESFCGYVSADADVVTTEELTDKDIVLAVTGTDDTSDDDCVEDCDAPQSCAFPAPTSSQALDAVDLLRRYFGAREDGEDGLRFTAAAEKAVLHIRKTQQQNITDFFGPKSA